MHSSNTFHHLLNDKMIFVSLFLNTELVWSSVTGKRGHVLLSHKHFIVEGKAKT